MKLSGKQLLGSIAAIAIALGLGFWLGMAPPATAPQSEAPRFRYTGPVEYIENGEDPSLPVRPAGTAKAESPAADLERANAQGVPAPADVATAPAQAGAGQPRFVGDNLELTGYRMTVIGADESKALGSGEGGPVVPGESKRFILVTVEITPTAEGSFVFHPEELFTLVDSAGTVYEVNLAAQAAADGQLTGSDLQKMEPAAGAIAFEVPEDASGFTLQAGDAEAPVRYTIAL